MTSHISVDFESFFSKKLKYGLKQMIAEEYCRHELFDCYLVGVCNGESVWAGHPAELNWEALNGQVWVSHNRYFDNTVFNELQRRKIIPAHIKPKEWNCTANLTAYLCNQRALQQAVETLYQVRVSKDYRDTADGKHWPKDYSEEEQKQVIAASKSDTQWCWKLWKDFSDKWPEAEKTLSNITIDQGMRGVQIDSALLNDYIVWTHELKHNTEKTIPWLRDEESEDWDDFNTKPTSTKCIAEQCRRKGIPCPPTKSEDEEGYEEWEQQYSKAHPWILSVSAWRSVNRLYCTFLTVKRRLRSDGTMPFALKYFGAHTGRWSGDAKINFQNMRKKPLFVRHDGFMESNEAVINSALEYKDEHGKWPEWVKHAIDFRALIIPRPGKKMISCDLSQIEPRVLAYIGGNWPLLQAIASGMGVYEAFARTSMKYTGGKMDKRSDYYKMIKIQVLGLGYGAGWEKFIGICWSEGGIDITKDDPEFIEIDDPFVLNKRKNVSGYGLKSKEIVSNFRAAADKITQVWKSLDELFKRSVGTDCVVTMPSGRKLTYHNVCCATTIVKDKETGKPKRETKFTAEVSGRRRIFYGGKLTENVTQAIARDVFASHVVAMHQLGWWNLFSVHDEAVLEVDDTVTAGMVQSEMSKCPEWLEGCPIGAEAKEIQHYEK